MHKTYAGMGLVAISVSVDELIDRETKKRLDEVVKEKVLKYLNSQEATFTNLLLDEVQNVWQEKLRIVGVPTVFVFNREGKWVQFKGDDDSLKKVKGPERDGKPPYYKYYEVEVLVKKLLEQK